MKLVIAYIVLFFLAIALFELGRYTSIHYISQAGLVVVLANIIVTTRICINLIRFMKQFSFR